MQRNFRRERIENVVGALLVIGLLAMLILSQRSIGWLQLGMMLTSLLGLIGVLARYNRRFK